MVVENVRKSGSRRINLNDGTNLRELHGTENCPVIRSGADIANLFERLLDQDHETLIAGTLDCNRLICWNLVWRSTDLFSPFPVDIFSAAINCAGTSLFLVHNKARTSPSDFRLVSRIAEAGMLIGIPLLDSIALSDDGYWNELSLENLQQHVVEKSIRRINGNLSAHGASTKDWRCTYCLSDNRVTIGPRVVPIDRKFCVPSRCSGCERLSWITNE